jgi:hypothetical protein
MRQVDAGTPLTAEAQEWMDKKLAGDPESAAKFDLRARAKKSLSAANWAGELMKGDSRFAASGEVSMESALQHQTVGLVTYDDYKKRKERLEQPLENPADAAVLEAPGCVCVC